MRLHSDEDRKEGIAPEIIDAGCELMQQLTFTKKNDREDYRLGAITKSCLKGDKGTAAVQEICRKLKDAVAKHQTSAFYHDDLLDGLFRAQPTATLEALCAGDAEELLRSIRILDDVRSRKHPLAAVPEEDLLRWCDGEPKTRYPAIARVITISQRAGEAKPLQWTSIALRLLEKAPEPQEVLEQFVYQFTPASGWSGSLAETLESHTTLLDDLVVHPRLGVFAAQEKVKFEQLIEAQRRSETARDKQRDERFE